METKFDSPSLAPTLPLNFSPASFFSAAMTSVKLNRTNYILWSRYAEVFLNGRVLKKHLDTNKPKDTNLGFDKGE